MNRQAMRARLMVLAALVAAAPVAAAPVAAQDLTALPSLRAHLSLESTHLRVGQPVWARFTLENVSDEAVHVSLDDGAATPAPAAEAMGLPIEHVFSANRDGGVTIEIAGGHVVERPLRFRRSDTPPAVVIAPRASVGIKLDLAEYFPVLRGSGSFRVTWQPYNGALKSETAFLEMGPQQNVELTTDFGRMTIRLFRDDAPLTVENFIELVKGGFYNGLTFHRIEPGYAILGGCPRGDGTGIRPDGKRVSAEFNAHPFEKGVVAMSLLEDDPDSASCQFFICNTRQKDWDGRYTVFGELTGDESFQTLDQLMGAPVDEYGRPTRTLYIREARVVAAAE